MGGEDKEEVWKDERIQLYFETSKKLRRSKKCSHGICVIPAKNKGRKREGKRINCFQGGRTGTAPSF